MPGVMRALSFDGRLLLSLISKMMPFKEALFWENHSRRVIVALDRQQVEISYGPFVEIVEMVGQTKNPACLIFFADVASIDVDVDKFQIGPVAWMSRDAGCA
jgi:hypothetical protein